MSVRIISLLTFGFCGFAALQVFTLVVSAKDTMSDNSGNSPVTISQDVPQKDDAEGAAREECASLDFITAIQTERDQLDQREARIAEREIILAELDDTLQVRLTEIKKRKAELEADLSRVNHIAQDDLTHLVDMYETMKPKQAAEIFDLMDPYFAAGFLREMESHKAGFILSEMDPKKSYQVSVIIANKHSKYR